MKPLLVLGLRGTLVERIHTRKVPSGMPPEDLLIGLSKVWLRPHVLETLLQLQKHCRLAVWSSTTARNTTPLVQAALQSPSIFQQKGLLMTSSPRADDGAVEALASSTASTSASSAQGDGMSSRFSKRGSKFGQSSTAATELECPLKFEFVWSREHTDPDNYRRVQLSSPDDLHATVKDLSRVFAAFPDIATPENTILVDDTPSKARMHAANFLWLDSCEGLSVTDNAGLKSLREFVEEEVVKAKDVRELLPRRLRGGSSSA